MRAQYSLDVCLLSPPAARLGRAPQNSLDVSLRVDRADALAKPPQSLYIFPGPPSRAGQGSPEENNSPSSLTCAPIVTQQACASTHTNRARHRYLISVVKIAFCRGETRVFDQNERFTSTKLDFGGQNRILSRRNARV